MSRLAFDSEHEGQTGVDDAWIERWRAGMRSDIAVLLDTFASRFGFPPGDHGVSGPATAAELDGLARLHGGAVPGDLLSFHRVVAEVELPDVNNGYWIHRPPLPGADPGHPRRLSDGRAVVVFGSDGGGALFALAGGSGSPVLRLADGSFLGGAYEADCATEIAANLQNFLTFLHRELTGFVASSIGKRHGVRSPQ
ncbi:hypothetical protein ACTOB_004436 [Actinoplanes oblitus]|uniref:Knr4/Smi1-like domain-containing protein n=1 Tax=Actinoplanes oblitus TaxID=3040509 RepID=A0ABY8W3Q9_9ACTN|nr:hypothetical protein [Actinoplanes oblitus]WIM92494.1 hypothetical protein ACTOB_004436 [Actinoplanes oblitus]